MPPSDDTFRQSFSDGLSRMLSEHINNLNGAQCRNLRRLVMSAVEKELIDFALDHCDGNRSQAAKMLGISRTTLMRKTGDKNASNN